MASGRSIEEGVITQGEDEEIAYTLDVSSVGSAPSAPSVTVKRMSDGEDVTGTTTTGGASVSGDIITLPKLSNLSDNVKYRVEVQYTIEGNVFETYFIVRGEE